jgi:uncharacterized protein YbaP (TraB family)
MKKFVECLIFNLILVPSFCQTTINNNSLLWRISGNGITNSSYLYGTMHLTDKRVFQLGDSVFNAMMSVNGFAAELDMNQVGMQMINYFLNQEEAKASQEAVKVKDCVSPEIWMMYKSELEKKLLKPADKITVDDLNAIEKDLDGELFRKGEMPTFLDAYLFGMARKMGKWVGGIEDFNDQVDHIEADDIESKIQMALFDDKYYRMGLESLLSIYLAQRLDSLDAMLYREEGGKKDLIMIRRNLKMARIMDSLAGVRSTMFAVGAAHLPGDSGVITLLRKKGYTVTPVFSKSKISADKYTIKSVNQNWETITGNDNSYTIQMPGKAEGLSMLEDLGINMKMYFDISFMKLYMTWGIDISEERKKIGKDSLYKGLRKKFMERGKVISEKTIRVNDVEGKEYRFSSADGEYKMQIFIPEMQKVVLNAVFTFKEKVLNEPETDRFFKSFINNPNYQKQETVIKNWSVYQYPQHSFSVELPDKPKEKLDVNSEEGKILHGYQLFNIKEQIFYGMQVTSMKAGMYSSGSDSVYFCGLKDNLISGFEESQLLDSAFILMNEYPAFRFSISGKSEGEQVQIRVLIVSRGNRGYYFYVVHQPGANHQANAERFLNSFKLLPYSYSKWETKSSSDGGFSTTTPFNFMEWEKEENDIHPLAIRQIVYDSVISSTIYIDKTDIPSWFWYSTDTGFLRNRAMKFISWDDSIANYVVTRKGNIIEAEFDIPEEETQMIKKVKIILVGNKLIEVFGTLNKADYKNTYYRFFDDFKVPMNNSDFDLTKTKADKLINVLNSNYADSTGVIKSWWDDLQFSTGDIPVLQQLMLSLYPDFDTTYYQSGLNGKIMEQLENLDSNNTTIDFIRKNYNSLTGRDEYLKPYFISYLSSVFTSEAYLLIKDFLLNSTYPEKAGNYFPNGFYDSLKLTAILYPDIMKLAGKEDLWWMIAGQATSLIDSNLLSKNTIRQYGNYFMESAKRELKADKLSIEENAYEYYDLIRILGIINQPESNALLTKFSKFDNRGLRYNVILAQLEAKQPVDLKTIYTLATTNEYRHDLYDELKKLNKQNLFPSEFLTQQKLAESKLYSYSSEEDPPASMQYLGNKITDFNGKKQKFYLFKIMFSDDPDAASYLGVAGPYSLDQKNYLSTHEATGCYYSEEYDAKKTEQQLKDYFKSLEE